VGGAGGKRLTNRRLFLYQEERETDHLFVELLYTCIYRGCCRVLVPALTRCMFSATVTVQPNFPLFPIDSCLFRFLNSFESIERLPLRICQPSCKKQNTKSVALSSFLYFAQNLFPFWLA
jgi:hypothetical protein